MRYISAQFSTEDGMDLILSAMDNANSQIETAKNAREDIIEGSGKSKEATDFLGFLSEFQSRQEQLLEFLLSGMNDFIGTSVDVGEPAPPPPAAEEPEEEEE